MSDGLDTGGVDLGAAAAQLQSALGGGSDNSAPAADTTAAPAAPSVSPTPSIDSSPAPVTQSGGHPAWSEILQAVPEALHANIRPTLEKWDRGVQDRLAQVQSQYAPYQDFVGQDPSLLQAGLQMVNLLNTDPQRLYEALAEHLGVSDQGQQDDEVNLGEFGDTEFKDPRVDQLLQQQQAFQAQMEQARVQQEQQQADTWLTEKVSATEQAIKARGIEPDMEYIITRVAAMANANPNATAAQMDQYFEAATQAYFQMVERFSGARTTVNNAPPVVAPGSAIPSSGFDPTKLSDKERRALGAQMLGQVLRGGS